MIQVFQASMKSDSVQLVPVPKCDGAEGFDGIIFLEFPGAEGVGIAEFNRAEPHTKADERFGDEDLPIHKDVAVAENRAVQGDVMPHDVPAHSV